MTATDYEQHVYHATSALGLTVDRIPLEYYDGFVVGYAESPHRWVWLPEQIPNELAYLVCLHEIGHCADPLQSSWRTHDTVHDIDCEIRAWRWAIDHTKNPISRRGRDAIVASFTTYLKWYGHDSHPFLDEMRHR